MRLRHASAAATNSRTEKRVVIGRARGTLWVSVASAALNCVGGEQACFGTGIRSTLASGVAMRKALLLLALVAPFACSCPVPSGSDGSFQDANYQEEDAGIVTPYRRLTARSVVEERAHPVRANLVWRNGDVFVRACASLHANWKSILMASTFLPTPELASR